MEKKTFKIIDELGIHARPSTIIVKTANKFESNLEVEYGTKKTNLKSMIGVMGLGVVQYGEITVIANGNDEKDAILGIEKILKEHNLI